MTSLSAHDQRASLVRGRWQVPAGSRFRAIAVQGSEPEVGQCSGVAEQAVETAIAAGSSAPPALALASSQPPDLSETVPLGVRQCGFLYLGESNSLATRYTSPVDPGLHQTVGLADRLKEYPATLKLMVSVGPCLEHRQQPAATTTMTGGSRHVYAVVHPDTRT